MRTLFIVSVLLLSVFFVVHPAGAAGTEEQSSASEGPLVIYTYDSFVSEWGPGPQVIPKFEEVYGIAVDIRSVGDAGQVLSRAILEKDDPVADILIGIDNNLLPEAIEAGVLEPYRSPGIESIDESLIVDPTFHITPFDYGYFTIIYDSERIDTPPESLEDLTAEAFADSLILMDPRTSTPGLGFVLWTRAVYGAEVTDYWERLQSSVLTITDGWDSGYGLFTSGEAPLVLSYTTSPAYHVEFEDTTRYRAARFEEGLYRQIEGVGITAGTERRAAAEDFVDFVLSEQFQSEIPLTNWMYPVADVPLPDSFEYAPKPSATVDFDPASVDGGVDAIIEDWLAVFGG